MGIFNFFIVIPEILAALAFGKILETVLTNESALVQLLGADNRVAAVVIGGISLAVAAALCTIITEPVAAPSSSQSRGSIGKPAESSV
jgi:maltose/moltooligosaccharide transporter